MAERLLWKVAEEVRADWKHVSPHAEPYLEAMGTLQSVKDPYYADSGVSVVLYFLSNATAWQGVVARRVKAELREMVKA